MLSLTKIQFPIPAPILGWGRYETFEFGCTVAFHDPSLSVRTYVVCILVTVLGIPLGEKELNLCKNYCVTTKCFFLLPFSCLCDMLHKDHVLLFRVQAPTVHS